jgi:hypothetical protein
VARKVIREFDSMEELGDFIRAGVDGPPKDEEPFRDMDGNPMTPQQVIELAREIERETGEQLIFRPGERRPAA